jgi:hypothetical protein
VGGKSRKAVFFGLSFAKPKKNQEGVGGSEREVWVCALAHTQTSPGARQEHRKNALAFLAMGRVQRPRAKGGVLARRSPISFRGPMSDAHWVCLVSLSLLNCSWPKH